jgi:hypothetical protein
MLILILKIAVVVVGWLIGFIAHRKHRQFLLAIPALITLVVLSIDSSHLKKLGNTVDTLFSSFKPVEKTALERYPDSAKEEAIRKYLEDLNRIGLDNEQLREENAKNLGKIVSLEKEDSKNKRQLSDLRKKTSEQQAKLDIIQEFTEVALWNHKGETDTGGVILSGPFSGVLNKCVTEANRGIVWQCDPEALEVYKRIIKQYPKYPFSYLYIGMCLKEAQDPSWRGYATKGLELFMKTTTIPQHSLGHDSGLKILKEALQESGSPIPSK